MGKTNQTVPKLRFPGFTDPWEQRKLGDVLGYEQPSKYIVKSTEYDDSYQTPVLTAGKSFLLGYTDEQTGIKDASCDSPVIVFDDFTTSSHVVNFPFKIKSSAMKLLQLKNDSDDFSFVANALARVKYEPQNHERHWISKFTKFVILTPNEAEQRQIGSFFQQLDTLITLHQRKLKHLQEQKKGLLQKLFPKEGENVPEVRFPGFTDPWEQRKLGDIAETYSGGTPSVGKGEYYNGGIPFIRSAEIGSEKIELTITKEGLKNSSARMVNAGDILYALYGATSGEVGRAGTNGAINQALLAIVPFDSYNDDFIIKWLEKEKGSITSTYLQGGQGNLSGAIVKNLYIAFPGQQEQSQIGSFFQQLDTLITLHQRKAENIQELKKALLQQMFI